MSTKALIFFCRVWAEWCAGQFSESLRDQLSAEMELNSLASTLVHYNLHSKIVLSGMYPFNCTQCHPDGS